MKLNCVLEFALAAHCTVGHPGTQTFTQASISPIVYADAKPFEHTKSYQGSLFVFTSETFVQERMAVPVPKYSELQKLAHKPLKAKEPIKELAFLPVPQTSGLERLFEKFDNKKSREHPGLLYVKNDGSEVMGCVEKNRFLMGSLAKIKKRFRATPIVDSGYRSPEHNRAVNGAKNSMHMQCRALDIRVPGVDKQALFNYLRALPEMGGVGIYASGFVHFDNGRKRSWDWRRSVKKPTIIKNRHRRLRHEQRHQSHERRRHSRRRHGS